MYLRELRCNIGGEYRLANDNMDYSTPFDNDVCTCCPPTPCSCAPSTPTNNDTRIAGHVPLHLSPLVLAPAVDMTTLKKRATTIMDSFNIEHHGLRALLITLRAHELAKDAGFCIDIQKIADCLGKQKGHIKRSLKSDTYLERCAHEAHLLTRSAFL